MATLRRDGWDTWVRVAAVAALTGCSGESVVAVDAQTAAPDLGATTDVVVDVGTLDRPTPDAGAPDAGAPDAGAPDVPPLDTPPFRCSARADCAGNAEGPACDVATGRCVPCTPADDACAAGSYCAPTNTCSPGCRDDGACITATDAGVDRGRCDPGTRQCVACASDDHCPPGNLCVGNVCVAGCSAARGCPTGSSCCEGACVDLQSSVAACGACGARCAVPNGTASCQNARCTVAVCTLPFADCDRSASNGCEADTRSDMAHCGGCGATCDARPNTVATCALGRCVRECVAGYADCDGDAGNGCEVDTRSDVAHCGACRAGCSPPNATAACEAGRCSVARCAAGFADCDGSAANGCEVDTLTAVSHCGSCGARCASLPNAFPGCTGGACVTSCLMGFQDCDGSAANGCEADLRSDLANCGACRSSCALPNATGACAMGGCVVGACATGFGDCDGSASNGCEVDLGASAAHCGACGTACAAGDVCAGGRCGPDLSPGRLAWYRFDGSLADSVRGAAGLGVAGGSASAYVAGRHGGALSLSGSAFVDVPDLPEQHAVTVAAWVRDVTRPGPIVDAWTRTENYLLQAASVSGAVRLSGGFHDWPDTASVFPEIHVTSGVAVPADRWHLGVATYDGGTLRLYADAVLQGSATTNRGAAYSSPGARVADLRIGVDRNGATLAATIDEVMIWNRALSQREISALYEAP